MTNLKVDGTTYDVYVEYESLKRSIEFVEGDGTGTTLTGKQVRDIVAVGNKYELTIVQNPSNPTAYNALYEVLSSPQNYHTFELPYDDKTINFDAYIESGSDTFEGQYAGHNLWSGLGISLRSFKPNYIRVYITAVAQTFSITPCGAANSAHASSLITPVQSIATSIVSTMYAVSVVFPKILHGLNTSNSATITELETVILIYDKTTDFICEPICQRVWASVLVSNSTMPFESSSILEIYNTVSASLSVSHNLIQNGSIVMYNASEINLSETESLSFASTLRAYALVESELEYTMAVNSSLADLRSDAIVFMNSSITAVESYSIGEIVKWHVIVPYASLIFGTFSVLSSGITAEVLNIYTTVTENLFSLSATVEPAPKEEVKIDHSENLLEYSSGELIMPPKNDILIASSIDILSTSQISFMDMIYGDVNEIILSPASVSSATRIPSSEANSIGPIIISGDSIAESATGQMLQTSNNETIGYAAGLIAKESHVPSGYTELEYVTSNGNSYFTTDIEVDVTQYRIRAVVKDECAVFDTVRPLWHSGPWDSSTNSLVEFSHRHNSYYKYTFFHGPNGRQLITYLSTPSDGMMTVYIAVPTSSSGSGVARIWNSSGDVIYTSTNLYYTNKPTGRNLIVFGGWNSAWIGRLYSFKYYCSNVYSNPQLDLVPALNNSTGVAGMYDTYNDRFYTSEGDPFIAGPEA